MITSDGRANPVRESSCNPIPDAEYIYLLRNDPITFGTRAFYELNPEGKLLHAPYLDLIASQLLMCMRGETRRLIIAVPPRHLKSHLVSVSFVAWLLGHFPSKHVICASYGQELAEKHARDCRTIMRSRWYEQVFGSVLGPRQAVHDFDTLAHGSRRSTSVGGPLTGLGADFLILDDVQTPMSVLSDAERRATNRWFDHTLLSRLNNPETGVIIIVMQRLHQDDLIGHLLER
jgi:hypothetical protein